MTDRSTDAQHHLDLLARDVASPVPAGLLDTARGARRRRACRRLATGGAIACVAAVALAATLPAHPTKPQPELPAAAPTPSGPLAPEGTKWISQVGYMVAVPRDWQQTQIRCSNGAVVDEGPGFYYLRLSPKDCNFGVEEPPPSVGIISASGGPSDLVCDPTCSQTVVDGPVELRVRRLASAEEVAAIVDTLRPLPDSWVRDPTSGLAAPLDDTVPDSRVATTRDEVVGQWAVIEVAGGPVPTDAELGLTIRTRGRYGLGLSYSDGVNLKGRGAQLDADGSLKVSPRVESTLVACVAPDGGTCGKPHGFGVADAVQARLTPDGNLVLVGVDGTALAVYRPQR